MADRTFRIETTVRVRDDDEEAVELFEEWAAGHGLRIHRRLAPFSDAGWSLGTLVSCDVMLHRNWWDGEIACADAQEASVERRLRVMLIEPVHGEIDMLEPCPPRKDGDSVLTPAGRLAWYREHLHDAADAAMDAERASQV